jgi:putative ABC transport system ATP-binding protein
MIHLSGVSKVYRGPKGPVAALRAVSLDVQPGEFVAVRGPSGCGKTTLLAIVGGLGRATAGTVRVAGEDLTAASPAARARFRALRVGFVFQMFHLLPYLTIVENVAAAAWGERRRTAQGRARELLDQFGLGGRLAHRPGELSAGERQRVAMARALLNRPALLLADEPTGNLDPRNAADVLELLRNFQAGGGSVLLVTHSEQAAVYAQRTILLRDGQVVPAGDRGTP